MLKVNFDEYQFKAIELALDKSISSVFISGVGGSGKSAIINYIKKEFDKKDVNYVLLAPTNSASKNIGGETLHSFFSLKPYENIEAKNEENFIMFDNFDDDDEYNDDDLILIVDEISMVGKSLLEKTIESRDFTKLIIVGDLEQLPPVKDKKVDYSKYCEQHIHLKNNYRATNPIVNKYVKEFRDNKVINANIKEFKLNEFDEDTYIIGYTNKSLSLMIDLLNVNETTGTEVILFTPIYIKGEKIYDNGDIVKLGIRDKYQFSVSDKFTIYKIDNGIFDDLPYPPKVIVGNYDEYKKYLNDKFKIFKEIMKKLFKTYNVNREKDIWNMYKRNMLSEIHHIELKVAFRDYIQIKNIPYARHKQFITSYKAQGKAYKKVVVLVDDIKDNDNMYVAMSRAIEDIKTFKINNTIDINKRSKEIYKDLLYLSNGEVSEDEIPF